jgi:hypothetical protein
MRSKKAVSRTPVSRPLRSERSLVLACASGALWLFACERPEEPSSSESVIEQGAPPSAAQAGGEQPGSLAVDVAWQLSSAGEASSMKGRIFNSTAETKVVNVRLVGQDPYGREVARELGTRTVGPRSSLDVSVPVRDLPVQSVGHPSTVALAVRYDLDVPNPDGSRGSLSHEVISPAAYVTFAEGFDRAVARRAAEQARETAVALRAGKSALTPPGIRSLRHYNPSFDRIDEVRAVPNDTTSLPLLSVTDVAPGPLPGSPPSSLPESEGAER